MKISGIYCIRNTANGKRYIGQSTDINFRLAQHKSCLKHGRHYNTHLQRAFNKYGKENFEFFIIGKHHEILLDVYEQVWIEQYKSNHSNYGYNLESGGHKGKHVSAETIEKIRKGMAGKKKSIKHKEAMSAAQTGKKQSFATLLKRVLAHKNYWKLVKAGVLPPQKPKANYWGDILNPSDIQKRKLRRKKLLQSRKSPVL